MTGASFVVFSLPRSRSAWLSLFLSGPGRLVGHDLGAQTADPSDFIAKAQRAGGTCETGAAFAWRTIQREMPEAKLAVVLRPPEDVAARLKQLGLGDHRDEMWRRWAHLLELRAEPGVLCVTVDDLADEQQAAGLYRHCTGEAMPEGRWAQFDPLNIQVDLPRWLGKLERNRGQIASLKALAAEMAHV